MHQAVIDYVAHHLPDFPGDVLDVGGRDINGTPRWLFENADSYRVVDLHEGDNVDVVGDITELGLSGVANTVLCLEVLEHAENWRDIVAACVAACRPGGTVIVTAAGPGREPHSAIDGGPVRDGEWYGNVTAVGLAEAFGDVGVVATRERGEDVQGVAWL